jgi:glycosyltransferase involved in cell wall biosynthesis
LYEHALFCVFPSLYEGWGLPVAEALALGKPVICSDRGPLPEVGGNLVEYIDPWDLPGWVDAIERLWLDEDRRQSMAERIVREYVRDDWSVAAHSLGRVALKLENQSNAR